MNRSSKICSALGAAACALLVATSAKANPIDNPCPSGGGVACQFRFDINSSIPFLDFSSGESATDLHPLQSYFSSYVDSAGTMTFPASGGSSMQWVDTSVSLNSQTVRVRLNFISVVGTTDLSGASPDISWTMTATASFFKNAPFGFDETNCTTDPFEIDIDGDWGNVTSDTFTIPAFASTACNNRGSIVSTVLGLGTAGATLTLYKFRAYNGSNPLTGS